MVWPMPVPGPTRHINSFSALVSIENLLQVVLALSVAYSFWVGNRRCSQDEGSPVRTHLNLATDAARTARICACGEADRRLSPGRAAGRLEIHTKQAPN